MNQFTNPFEHYPVLPMPMLSNAKVPLEGPSPSLLGYLWGPRYSMLGLSKVFQVYDPLPIGDSHNESLLGVPLMTFDLDCLLGIR